MRKPSLLNKMKESKFFKKMFCYYVKMQLFCRRFKIKTLEKVEKNKSMDTLDTHPIGFSYCFLN